MSKKLVHSYTFTPSTNTIVIKGVHRLERFLLITNVTDNINLFTFNCAERGISSYSIDNDTKETTIVLDYDCSTMDAADKLQIFIEEDSTKFDPSDSMLDPVNKLRVVNPQNLIDTDFEYGLQPSKWETVELVNNVPSFYANQTDYIIPDVFSVLTVSGSTQVTVNTREPHGLSVGAPIDVQGLGIRTAEGKFIITKVPTTTSFVYKAKGSQTQTGDISGVYTTIVPGQFYNGSDLKYEIDTGIVSDQTATSTLSVDTNYVHGFNDGTSLYFTNTVGKQIYEVSNNTSSSAPDGRPYVDIDNTLTANVAINTELTETKQMTGTYAHKFTSASVNTADNTIVWVNHQLRVGDALLYVPPGYDTEIGGLGRFEVYYVKSIPTDNTITLCETTNGTYSANPEINLTSQGTSNFGRHQLILCYEVAYQYKGYRGYYSYFRHREWQDGSGSGWDLAELGSSISKGVSGNYGLGGVRPDRVQFLIKNGGSVDNRILYYGNVPYYSTYLNSNFTTSKASIYPDGYDFIEDFNRFSNYSRMESASTNTWTFNNYGPRGYFVFSGSYYDSVSQSPTDGTQFMIYLQFDPEADSFYAENHGLNDGDQITFTTDSGFNISYRSDTGTTYSITPTFTGAVSPFTTTVRRISSNRFRLDGASRLRGAGGGYSVTAQIDNDTGDSFYIGDYDFTNDEKIFIEPINSGVLPTTATGVVTPSNSGTLKTIYNAVNSELDSIKTLMGSESGQIVYNGGSEYYPLAATNTFFDGGYQYYYFYRNTAYFYSPVYGSAYSWRLDLASDWATGEEFELYEGLPVYGKGYKIITTPFAQGDTVPYHVDIVQTPYDPTIVNGNSYVRNYLDGYGYNYYNSGVQTTSFNNDYVNWTTLSNGWRYTYEAIYSAANSSYHGYLNVMITIDNSNWPGYYLATTLNMFDDGSSGREVLLNENASDAGQRYNISVRIPIKNGSLSTNYGTTTGTIISGTTVAANLANAVVNTLTKPTLTAGVSNEVYAEIVNGQRIAIKNSNGIKYDLTSHGTADLQISTEEKTGGVDGYYTVTGSSDYNLSCLTNRQIPKRTVDFTANNVSTISGTDYIAATDHKLRTGQSVVYVEGTGSLSGLANGTTYYVSAPGPDEIALSSTYIDAVSGTTLSLGTATGSASLETASVSGISAGEGTVTFSSESNIITGTDTLFKRYFKPNDKIRLLNDTTIPQSYVEFEIASVLDDNELTLTQDVGWDEAVGTNYYVATQLHVRPDGSTLHRPFDGGVEINAGTSPNSSIVRQTRKYFRYQSGKGIQVSLAINFNPARLSQFTEATANTATITTEYPHGITIGDTVTIDGSSDTAYNGTFDITAADEFTFSYDLGVTPTQSIPTGIIKYNVETWTDSNIRAGLFDYQNGMFFEYDGQELYAVRRSSVQQLPGTVTATYDSNIMTGIGTRFVGQLVEGDFIVIRGMSHKITKIISDTEIHVQPSYRGITASGIIATKTIDEKVAQSNWSIDKCDGTGPTGFNLDITKIQMAYIDYSWYGAGKIRFGFKDNDGKVQYVHDFLHNNRLEEAYMRSGNIPARYEIFNESGPTFTPGLFHWGTSVIMDGEFDDDKAYQFTAPSNTLTFTNGDSDTSTTNSSSTLVAYYAGNRQYDWYVRLSFPSTDGSLFATGTKLYTTGGELNGDEVAFTDYSGSNVRVYIYVRTSRFAPTIYPVVNNSTVVNVGAPSTGGSDADLTDLIPLISIRLAPSVDNNISGELGARDIINRMQLQLKSCGITLSHDCDAYLMLNGSIDNKTYEVVGSPSLSQLIKHDAGDRIIGGSEIFSFRASGGTADAAGKRLNVTSDFDLSKITDMGNSILGGDGVFPNGPDLLTIAVKPIDTSAINSASPLLIYGRITWTESQA